MELTVSNFKVIKFNFERIIHDNLKAGDVVTVTMKLEVHIKELSKISDNKAKIVSDFLFNMLEFGNYTIETQAILSSKEMNKIIDLWTKNPEKDLPAGVNFAYVNSLYYYVMPLVISISEKAKIPIPLPPLEEPSPLSSPKKKIKPVKQ